MTPWPHHQNDHREEIHSIDRHHLFRRCTQPTQHMVSCIFCFILSVHIVIFYLLSLSISCWLECIVSFFLILTNAFLKHHWLLCLFFSNVTLFCADFNGGGNGSSSKSSSNQSNGSSAPAEFTFKTLHEAFGREILNDFNERNRLKQVAQRPLIEF